MLQLFIEHRADVVRRRTQYELRKAREREHILLGYRIALDYIDDVIKVIRGSSSRANARENLHEFFENKSVKVSTGTVLTISSTAKKIQESPPKTSALPRNRA